MISPSRPRRLPAIVAAAAVSFFAGGCTTGYQLKVDAISAPKPTEAVSYKIKTKSGSTEADSLRAQEAAIFVKTALSGKGLYEAPNPDAAEMVVVVDYGIEPPKVRMERTSVPVYAQIGGGVRYEQRSIIDSRGMPNLRTVPVYEPPRTEMVGMQEVITPVEIYEKYLRISAHENKPTIEGKAPAEIWSVNISSEDESKDLRKYLPLLASASADYIGRDTHTAKVIKVRETDPGVGFVKKGL
jgi:hypothetical protein